MKKLIAVIAALLLLVGCTVVQNAADRTQRAAYNVISSYSN